MALDSAGNALASLDLEGMLQGGEAIERALAALPPPHAIATADAAQLRATVQQAQAALIRCRRLGTALADMTRLALSAQTQDPRYPGDDASRLSGRGINTRV